MNTLKHMEAIFIAALVLAGVSSYAQAATSRAAEAHTAQASVAASPSPVAVVKVSAKRPA
jgi:hypothetical protein